MRSRGKPATPASVKVEWANSALLDVERHISYIRTDNPIAARRVMAQLLKAADSLHQFPERCPLGDVPGTR
jgi:plasmid stabilization system protein ParE